MDDGLVTANDRDKRGKTRKVIFQWKSMVAD